MHDEFYSNKTLQAFFCLDSRSNSHNIDSVVTVIARSLGDVL